MKGEEHCMQEDLLLYKCFRDWISICILSSHRNQGLEQGMRSVDYSPALLSPLPERSRTDIMESDSLLAILSVNGKIQSFGNWMSNRRPARGSLYLALSVPSPYTGLLPPPNTKQNNGWDVQSHCSTPQVDLFVCDHPDIGSIPGFRFM